MKKINLYLTQKIGKDLSFSYFSSHLAPYKIIIVASPPSSTMISGPFPPGKFKAL
jgi:hypothetical protein